ncbi:endonuclease/exonuclease/phosphatase family protein [Streptomyces sp. DH24]|uniref:endonuclease/exonuclease/phosphatase family protein n=1 Tax=Streptomyces sp. DH24 TaxID=3040123 RepID=UPI0024417C6C|nr:endonuclease/exonuclease/phosphatase family protein [Streptomyces sp. DH24]MDG9717660.1 endonuclease/exonuclease/phosphatase family protein [Streptomyces sp. DH24]
MDHRPTAVAESSTSRRVRMMTVNVLDAGHADWGDRRRVLAAGIAQARPDVIAVQEIVRSAEYDGVRDVLGEGWHVVAHPRWSRGGVGAVLASRWPFGTVKKDAFRETGRIEAAPWCGVVVAQVAVPAPFGPLVVAHHKPSWPRGHEHERERQAVTAARLVESMIGGGCRHAVVLGDFDAAPDSASVRFWQGRQSLDQMSVCYRDAWEAAHPDDPGHTFSPDNPLVQQGDMPREEGRRIDYVMVRCDDHGPTLEVERCERMFTQPVEGVWASDHFGLLAEMCLPARPGGSRT